ncbi:hypothetical protein NFI96_000585 [Prochilodus magdalenae]|nr:hypothetical protein NFI96_000585 [Prochilodus magdalenae]
MSTGLGLPARTLSCRGGVGVGPGLLAMLCIHLVLTTEHRTNFVYSREELLALRTKGRAGKTHPIPEELRRSYRGCRAGAKLKAKRMEKHWRLQTQHPDAFIAISGDFNHITLDSVLTAFHQYVDCPTRKNRTIDLLYANVKDAYTATPLPPLGKSDHNLVHLQPQYKPRVRTQPITTRSFRKWSPAAEAALRDCFESTEWSVLQEPYGEDI